ncbi:hypothetical protein RU030_002456 [Salmonella enterica]|nr:hypothetical protein [Salmonella enterica]
MVAFINIVIEKKNGRVETAMTGSVDGEVIQEEVVQLVGLAEVIREALVASGGELQPRFDVEKAMKAASAKTH